MSHDNKFIEFNSKKLTEEDVKYQFITPAIEHAGWKKNQLRFEYAFTDGKMHIKGNKGYRGKRKRADYLLFYKPNIPIAIVEAKDMNHAFDDGIQQALGYARTLDIPFAYSSNGKSFMEHNILTGEVKELAMSKFPSPETLWQKYINSKSITPEEEDIITEPDYFDQITKKEPRYYQRIAINRTMEAIAQGNNRILLVMATGTGKTFTAFQIAYKLWNAGIKKRILYLADRNILIDQTMIQDFKPFEKVMTKISNKKLDSSYEIYFSLYQQLVNNDDNENQPYQEFSSDFFDLIIVDECHRGSAKEDSQWRKILEYFHSATQIGMTATPKEDREISTTGYFGEPLYTYSLKEGINDGFLAPYRVKRIGLDVDLDGYRPEKGKVDVNGKLIEDREYNVTDYDRNIIIDDRTKVVAQKVTEYLKRTDRYGKTIIFCVDQEHALRMRQALINENKDLVAENDRYIMRITSDDVEGKRQLDYFIDTDEKYPTIVTTSDLLSTGVDCKTCKLIVLENNIESMTKFKQIIGRGTRLRTDYGKYYFTIMDFRGSTKKFADPEFDGIPEPEKESKSGRGGGNRDSKKETEEQDSGSEEKYRINDVKVYAILEKNLCFDAEGDLITENLISFSKNNIINEYHTLEEFINHWNEFDKKQAISDELYEHDIFLEELREAAGTDQMDDFDLICHIAFDKKPLTRSERANNVKKRDYLSKFEGIARQVLEGLLDKYATDGIGDLENMGFLENEPFRQYGSPMKIAKEFGGKQQLKTAISDLQREIYS